MEEQRLQEKTAQESLRVVLIVQARMGATRLPGKPMLEVRGRTLLSYLIERLKRVKNAQGLVIATTLNPQDDEIVEEAEAHHVTVYRGSERNVLQRYWEAAQQSQADIVVRITADCPLIDPQIVEQCIDYFLQHPSLDYVSNTLEKTFPRGLDTEVFSRQALERAHKEATLEEEREHVTLYIYRHPEKFKLHNIKNIKNLSHFRWTVDTPEDFQLIKLLLENAPAHFHLADIEALLHIHPEWANINAHIKQKHSST